MNEPYKDKGVWACWLYCHQCGITAYHTWLVLEERWFCTNCHAKGRISPKPPMKNEEWYDETMYCPVCESGDVEPEDDPDKDGYVEMRCNHCGHVYFDVVELVEGGKNE